MSSPILVTYASRTGSTAGVATVIGQVLAEKGALVAVQPIGNVRDVTPYQAVIVGSAIQRKQWLPEAMALLRTHQAALAQKQVAIFSVCITMALKEGAYREAVAGWLEPVRRLVKPISEGYFAGRLDIGKVPSLRDRLMFRVSVASGIWTEGDHRDWEAIRAWARALAAKLEAIHPT